MRLNDEMTLEKTGHEFIAQAETLLIYGIFLFLTGLAQIGVTMGQRYIVEQSTNHGNIITLSHFVPTSLTATDVHLWYIYPSAALTIVPCLFCVIYAIFKRQWMAIFICLSSMISFIASSVYVGLLIIHTLEYWQTLSLNRFKATRTVKFQSSTVTSASHLLLRFDEPATFTNLALLITFTLALVQALLSLIGAVISCLWSPCCFTSSYRSMNSNTGHYGQNGSHRYENPPSSTVRSLRKSQQQMDSHRFPLNDCQEPMLNGLLHNMSPIRSNYDEV